MTKKQIIFSASAGHMIENFDSYLYGYFAFLLAPIFFPSGDATTALIASFGAFAAGFIMRPIGGILFGHIGDRFGRKLAFLFSIVVITIPTFGIGCLPSYDTIGIAAPILLICFRLLQGVSLGGEFGGAALFIREHIKKGASGYAGSILVALGYVGVIVGTGIGAIFTQGSMPPWAWRIPFLLGGAFGIAVYFMRRKLMETPTFQEMEEKGNILKVPILAVVKKHYKGVLSGVGIGMNVTTPSYLAIIYMSTHYKDQFNLSTSEILAITSGLMAFWAILLPVAGRFADIIGRRRIMAFSALATLLVAYPVFHLMHTTTTFMVFLSCQVLISLTSIPYVATCASVLPVLFPPAERYSGSAFSYSLGVALFGGTAPLIVSWLVNHDISFAPAGYTMLAGLVGWLAVRTAKLYEEENFKQQPLSRAAAQGLAA